VSKLLLLRDAEHVDEITEKTDGSTVPLRALARPLVAVVVVVVVDLLRPSPFTRPEVLKPLR